MLYSVVYISLQNQYIANLLCYTVV